MLRTPPFSDGTTRHGYSAGSQKGGSAHAKALQWLRQAEPEIDEDKLAVIVALSGPHTGSGYRETDYRKHGVGDFQKMESLLKGIDPKKDNGWFDLFAITKIPHEVKKPDWSELNVGLLKKYRETKYSPGLKTLNDHLHSYLITVAHWTEGKRYAKHEKILVKAMKATQQKDGSFSVENTNDQVAVTALSAMHFTLHYITAHRFFAPPTKEEPRKTNDTEIVVEVDE